MADRRSSGDDSELWRAATSEVTPLRGRKSSARVPTKQTSQDAPERAGAEAVATSPPQGAASDTPVAAKPSAPSFAPLSPATAPGVDKRTVARLRRGQLPIDARIDLHGLTQREAHRELAAFLEDSRDAQRRTVLVITGKGEGGQGVLREAVPRWINEAALRPLVLALAPAQPKDGGTGALYLLLRRRR